MAYRIKSVTALTGLTPATLRAWERRYDLVSPSRSKAGYRLYSEDEVALLTRVKSLVDKGMAVSEAVRLIRRGAPILSPDQSAHTDQIRDGLLDALLHLDRPAAERAATPLVALSVERRMEAVFLPVLREIGARWARGEASIVQEHFASAYIREKLVDLLQSLGGGTGAGAEAVCAGAPEEDHELGLMSIAVYLALHGWRITYLGPHVPAPELAPVLCEHQPALLCTSLLRTATEQQCLDLARSLRAVAPPQTRVVVGGSGVPHEVVGSPAEGLHLVRSAEEMFDLIS